MFTQPGGVGVERGIEVHLRVDAPFVAFEAVMRMAFDALHRPPRDVQLADQGGLVAEAREMLGQQHLIRGQGVVDAVHAVPGGQPAGQHAGAARRADRHVHVAALEHHATGGEAVQGGRGDGRAAVAAQGIPALLVAHQQQNVGSTHRCPESARSLRDTEGVVSSATRTTMTQSPPHARDIAGESWDPAQYLKFSDHRLRPALDLMERVPLADPRRICDLGCGSAHTLPACSPTAGPPPPWWAWTIRRRCWPRRGRPRPACTGNRATWRTGSRRPRRRCCSPTR